MLIEDLVTNMLPLDMTECSADKAWYSYYSHLEEFKDVPLEQFREQVSAHHRKQVNGDLGRAIMEEAYYVHDRRLHPQRTTNGRGELVFDLHPAKLLLRDDVANNRHVGLRPSQRWSKREEYMEFDLPIFKECIYRDHGKQNICSNPKPLHSTCSPVLTPISIGIHLPSGRSV